MAQTSAGGRDGGGGGGAWPAGDPDFVYRLFDELPLMVIAMEGPEHRIRALTGVYRQFIGRDDVIGAPLLEFFPELLGQRVSPIFDRVLATGRPESVRDFRIHYFNPAAGQTVEIFLDFDAFARLGPGGEVSGVVVHVQDVSQQVRERQAAQERTAVAVQRYQDAREVITALQRQLLPAGLPVLPQVRIGGSYLLADADDAAGGDWFDAVPFPDGKVVLVVGDVVGHGVAASAAMGQLRAVLQDRLDDRGDLVDAIAAADRMARRVQEARAATVCLVLLDPEDGAVSWCSAGHPPPLVAGPDRARFLAASGDGPLGTGPAPGVPAAGSRYAVQRDRLEPGEVLLLYSDGIVERPGRTPAEADDELAQVVRDVIAGRGFHGDATAPVADRVCLQALELLVRETGHDDDITLLAAQRRAPAPALQLGGPGVPVELATARTAVDSWLADLDAGRPDRTAFAHAVVELVTNAHEHARPDTTDLSVIVTAGLDPDGQARLTVADNGRWRQRPRPGDDAYRRDHGYGLAMAASLVDSLAVDPGEHGTTVTARRRLSHPARLLTADQISHGRPAAPPAAEAGQEDLVVVLDQPGAPSSRIAVRGPLDAGTVEDFGVELDRYTLGGTHDLVVDLTGVTHLASAAVAELYRTGPDGEHRRYPLRLYAPPGSTAHHVLALVGLPHTTTDPHEQPQAPAEG